MILAGVADVKIQNQLQVVTLGCGAVGDGVTWELREGAGPYDMTVEQLLQKQDKRDRTREYRVVAPFSGAWLPLPSQGCRVACNPPCTGRKMSMTLFRGTRPSGL